MASRGILRLLACALLCSFTHALDAPTTPNAPAIVEDDDNNNTGSPAAGFLRSVRSAVLPPLKMFASAPPITRSWVSASVLMAVLTSQRIIDPRNICFSEPMVLHEGEWWRLLANFFYMGDALKSIFFWVQLHHFWECCKMLELVKYRWEPADFIKLIVCNAGLLLFLKQWFPSTIFLGTPMVMAFLYMYAREYELQVMNLLGFFSIRCGWLPFAQMLQDLLQAGDVTPNILGLMSGHTYYFLTEVKPRLEVPADLSLDDVLNLVVKNSELKFEEAEEDAKEEGEEKDEEEGEEAAAEGEEDDDDGDDGDGDDDEEAEEEEEKKELPPGARRL